MAASQAILPAAQGGEHSDGGDEDHSASVQVEAIQYGEVSQSLAVPTKTGEEEAVYETQYDDERPRTAGSAYSAQSDYNNASDRVAGLLITSKPEPNEPNESPAKAVFVRPTAGLETASPPAFTFSKANRPQLDMVGTRKGPLAAVDLRDAKAAEREAAAETQTHGTLAYALSTLHDADHSDAGHQPTEVPPSVQEEHVLQQEAHQSAEQQQGAPEDADHIAIEAEQQTVQPAEPLKMKRKKRKKRYDTAPTEQPEAYAYATPAEEPLLLRDEMEYQNTHVIQNIEPTVEPEQAEVFEPAAEHLEDARPATPVTQFADTEATPADGSPQIQLQHDLQAAAFEQSQVVDADSALAGDRATEGNVDDAMQHQHSLAEVLHVEDCTSLQTHLRVSARRTEDDRPQQQAMRPATRGAYARGRALGMQRTQAVRGGRIDRRALGLTNTGAALVRRQGPSRRSTAPAPSGHPSSELPPTQRQPSEHPMSDPLSSDGISEMEGMVLKVREKTKALKQQHGTDREALHAKIEDIVAAKQALQDDLTTVQQQKTDLSALLEQQRGKTIAYETKLNRFKTFVTGLGNDVDALKKEAGTTRRKGEQLAQEGGDRKAEQAALFQQLSMCAEKSAQLKDQALRACQEAQSDLQAAQIRNEYLEKQLSERIGLLAEERDRRAQLERQLVTVASSDEHLLRALKQNNDAVLDKLFEIHATLEDDESQKTSVEMVEKTLAAVQGLNTQQSSNADDLVSVKDMVEALSEK